MFVFVRIIQLDSLTLFLVSFCFQILILLHSQIRVREDGWSFRANSRKFICFLQRMYAEDCILW